MIMSVTSPVGVVEDGPVSKTSPRAGGPRPRRSFNAAEKLAHVRAYEAACAVGDGGGYLRREGLYSSLISEWRRARDAGLLEGKPDGVPVGRPSAEQAEIARLRRELEVTRAKLATTETALQIMGKAHELLDSIAKSSETQVRREQR
jgi:transposase